MSSDESHPVNPIAPVVVLLTVIVVAVEGVLSLASAGMVGGPGGVGWRLTWIQDWGFFPAVWEQVVHRGDFSVEMLKRFVTYGFVHGSFTHALFGAVLLLALGKFVGDIFAPWAVLVVFLGGLIVGALVFGLIVDGPRALFGVYPGVYAMIGAFTYVLWVRLGQRGENQLRAFRLIGVLMALQLVFNLLFGTDPGWIAELAGFGAGFVLSVAVSPGGFAALRARLQAR